MEIGRGCVLTLGEGDELVAGTLDDCKRNEVARHFREGIQVLVTLNGSYSFNSRFEEPLGLITHFWFIFVINENNIGSSTGPLNYYKHSIS